MCAYWIMWVWLGSMGGQEMLGVEDPFRKLHGKGEVETCREGSGLLRGHLRCAKLHRRHALAGSQKSGTKVWHKGGMHMGHMVHRSDRQVTSYSLLCFMIGLCPVGLTKYRHMHICVSALSCCWSCLCS